MMGGAVLNGGMTTFLAVIILSDSTSHALITFFKVFFLTVVFGLYHAMTFLPVMLCLEPPNICVANNDDELVNQDKRITRQKEFEESRKEDFTKGLQLNELTPNESFDPTL
jgi:hypothetical protein